ncbi:MAG: hypothetical protein BWK76_13825 [Desulfobulbaceae bacterium A2]|nr:MAG: hypothetical protein BWK76_13825 [Desulfobulbaceae bacterium A2]
MASRARTSPPSALPPAPVTLRRADWFALRRDLFIRQALEEFFHSSRMLQEILERRAVLFQQPVDPDQIQPRLEELWRLLTDLVGSETMPGPLWRLKDLCHRIWPREEPGEIQGRLFDWLTGSCFHEAMKLKENIYLLRGYARTSPGAEAGGWEASAALEMLEAVRRDACRELERLSETLGRAALALRRMLPTLANNGLVPRLLLEEEAQVTELWNETLEAIWVDMFDGRPETGFCAAGASYLSGHWFHRALAAYRRALAINPRCHEAIARGSQLERIVEEHGALLEY